MGRLFGDILGGIINEAQRAEQQKQLRAAISQYIDACNSGNINHCSELMNSAAVSAEVRSWAANKRREIESQLQSERQRLRSEALARAKQLFEDCQRRDVSFCDQGASLSDIAPEERAQFIRLKADILTRRELEAKREQVRGRAQQLLNECRTRVAACDEGLALQGLEQNERQQLISLRADYYRVERERAAAQTREKEQLERQRRVAELRTACSKGDLSACRNGLAMAVSPSDIASLNHDLLVLQSPLGITQLKPAADFLKRSSWLSIYLAAAAVAGAIASMVAGVARRRALQMSAITNRTSYSLQPADRETPMTNQTFAYPSSGPAAVSAHNRRKRNKVVRVSLSGGIIGLLTTNPRKALEDAIDGANQEGWNAVHIIEHSTSNMLVWVLQILVLVITFGLWTWGAGYLILMERESA